jgi:hypothetical protein
MIHEKSLTKIQNRVPSYGYILTNNSKRIVGDRHELIFQGRMLRYSCEVGRMAILGH